MPRTRTFLAIGLDKKTRDRISVLQDELAESVSDMKWVEPESMHVTLLFLGEVDDRELPAICRAAQDAVRDLPAFPLSVEGVGCFPNPRRPRVLWVGLGEGALHVVAVHDALEAVLLELGCYRREERKYTPHVTLGRVKNERPSAQLGSVLTRYEGWSAGELAVGEVHVMASHLSPRGPVYTVLGRAKLADET